MSSTWQYLRKHWFTFVIYFAFSLVFFFSAIYSAVTYSRVVDTQTEVTLENPAYDMEELPNGSLRFTFSVLMVNPSAFDLHLYSTSWRVLVSNGTLTNPDIFLVSDLWGSYTGTTLEVPLASGDNMLFSYEAVLSDRARIQKLWGFVNYSATQGIEYTISTVPYEFDFEVLAWIGDFRHDYDRTRYLNELVRVDLEYNNMEVGD